MSKKYYDKILSGSGTSSVKVKSAFGSKILAKYGWTEGQGLGARMNGEQECVQIEKREERVGIGAEKTEKSEWDNWWNGAYDSVASRIAVKVGGTRAADSSDSSEEMMLRKKKRKDKKEKRQKEEDTGEKLSKKRRVKRHVRDE